jgi:hypothetical protein
MVRARLSLIGSSCAMSLALAPPRALAEERDCAARLDAAGAELATVEPEFVARTYPRTVFAHCGPNPAAERVLTPLVERALGGGGGAAGLAIECRTWACRIRVLHGARLDPAGWERALTGPTLAGRLHTISVVGRRPTTDAFDGEDLVEATVYFKLTDPSGGPARSARRPRTPAGADCQAQLADVERRLAEMKRLISHDPSPAERFAREPPNEALTRDLEARLGSALAALPSFARVTASCHGVICQVLPPAGVAIDQASWRQLEARPELRAFIVGRAYAGAAYWLVRPSQTADGRALLEHLVSALERGPIFDACHRQHPAAGHLLVSYHLAGRDPLGRAAKQGGLTTVVTGSLADTALGRCVAGELERAMATAALPAEVLNYTQTRRYDWAPDSDRVVVHAR